MEYTCPITLELFRDPVQAADGHTYDRAALEAWFAQHPGDAPVKSPCNGTPMERTLMRSFDFYKAYRRWCEEHGHALPTPAARFGLLSVPPSAPPRAALSYTCVVGYPGVDASVEVPTTDPRVAACFVYDTHSVAVRLRQLPRRALAEFAATTFGLEGAAAPHLLLVSFVLWTLLAFVTTGVPRAAPVRVAYRFSHGGMYVIPLLPSQALRVLRRFRRHDDVAPEDALGVLTAHELRDLAERIGVPVAGRQSKAALVAHVVVGLPLNTNLAY